MLSVVSVAVHSMTGCTDIVTRLQRSRIESSNCLCLEAKADMVSRCIMYCNKRTCILVMFATLHNSVKLNENFKIISGKCTSLHFDSFILINSDEFVKTNEKIKNTTYSNDSKRAVLSAEIPSCLEPRSLARHCNNWWFHTSFMVERQVCVVGLNLS